MKCIHFEARELQQRRFELHEVGGAEALADAGAYIGPLYPPRLPRGGNINSAAATLFLEQPNAADGIASGDEGDPFDDDYWDSDLNGD